MVHTGTPYLFGAALAYNGPSLVGHGIVTRALKSALYRRPSSLIRIKVECGGSGLLWVLLNTNKTIFCSVPSQMYSLIMCSYMGSS